MSMPFDAYVLRARLAPAALSAAPAIVLCLSLLPSLEGAGSILAFVLSSMLIVVCAVVRDLGRRLESALWDSWGGAPTTRLLRWRGAVGVVEQTRLHHLLEELIGEPLPSVAEEQTDPEAADERYEVATTVLRQRTRGGRQFRLLAEQNAEYGMRRNCLGLRPPALSVAAVVFAVSVVLFFAQGHAWHYALPAAVALLGLLAWGFLVTDGWVRSAADLYAKRLMEAIETLAQAGIENKPGSVVHQPSAPREGGTHG